MKYQPSMLRISKVDLPCPDRPADWNAAALVLHSNRVRARF
jgi:hypothetical protein